MQPAVYLILFSSAFLISWLTTGWAISLANRWGFMDEPGERKIHHQTKPRLGGLGICSGFYLTLIPIVLAVYYLPIPENLHPLIDKLLVHRSGLVREWWTFWGLVAGGGFMFVGGLVDDRYTISPRSKLVWQILASLLLISAGYRFSFYRVFWASPVADYVIGIPITVFWMVFLCNAFNLLDNMDGLSGGVAAITTTFFAMYAHFQGEFFLAAAMMALVGALAGFLRYNWHPSKIFMGDGGALLIGILIAAFTCRCTYYHTSPGNLIDWLLLNRSTEAEQGILSLLTPLVIMAVPIFDTASVVFIRWRNHKPLMQGDRNHFSHRLVALGLSQRQAVEVIYATTIFTGLGALILRTSRITEAFLILLQVLSVFAMIILLERARNKS